MHYTVDDYTDPWRDSETILMLHGNAEAGAAWYGWVPHLARHFRVVRPDMRGFGASTPMPREHTWTIDELIADYVRLMNALGIERFHLVGAKLGGTIARAFAARQPQRLLTLTVVGTPRPDRPGGDKLPALIADLERDGVGTWAARNMAGRLGAGFPQEGLEWWTRFMARTALSTEIGFQRDLAYADICFDGWKCPSIMEVPGAKDVAVEFFTMSKSYNMAGWRVGFMVGNRDLVYALGRIKGYHDYGTFTPIQVASIAALEGPQECVTEICMNYQRRRDVLVKGLHEAGWMVEKPRATMYVWAKIPDAYAALGSLEFSKKLLADAKVSVSPGIGFGDFGDGFVRFAMIENESRTRQAVRGIKDMFRKDGLR